MNCIQKIQYRTKTQARKAAKKFRIKYRKPQYFYQCDQCGLFHLSTHKGKGTVYEIKSMNMRWVQHV